MLFSQISFFPRVNQAKNPFFDLGKTKKFSKILTFFQTLLKSDLTSKFPSNSLPKIPILAATQLSLNLVVHNLIKVVLKSRHM